MIEPMNLRVCRAGLHKYLYSIKYCIECKKLKTQLWKELNREKEAKNIYSWKEKNKEKETQQQLKWRQTKAKAYFAEYRKLNAAAIAAKEAKYRATKLKATPLWLTKEQLHSIKLYYLVAKWIQSILNEQIDVDHIVPLQGKNSCGLHVPWNLQLLTNSDNVKKGNR